MLSGCYEQPRYENDQKERQELFFKCLEKIPEGPQQTQYNDWSEVVDECSDAAYDLSRKCYENCKAGQ